MAADEVSSEPQLIGVTQIQASPKAVQSSPLDELLTRPHGPSRPSLVSGITPSESPAAQLNTGPPSPKLSGETESTNWTSIPELPKQQQATVLWNSVAPPPLPPLTTVVGVGDSKIVPPQESGQSTPRSDASIDVEQSAVADPDGRISISADADPDWRRASTMGGKKGARRVRKKRPKEDIVRANTTSTDLQEGATILVPPPPVRPNEDARIQGSSVSAKSPIPLGGGTILGPPPPPSVKPNSTSPPKKSNAAKNAAGASPSRNSVLSTASHGGNQVLRTKSSKENRSILQFSTAIYFAKEGEDFEMYVDVMRLGPDTESCSCTFETKDSSAKAGLRYGATSGQIKMHRGESMQVIKVPILDTNEWSGTLEFEIHLSRPQNCLLGKYLWKCRVKVIDSNAFPTDRFRESILDHAQGDSRSFAKIPWYKLLHEYFKMNFSNPVIRRRTKQMLITDQFQNLYFIWRLLAVKILVDKVINIENCTEEGVLIMSMFPCPKSEAERETQLLIFMCLIVVPFVLVHYIDYSQVHWKVGGTSRKIIQGNLLRKFLNYDECARSTVKAADLTVAMTRDTQTLVHDAYMQLFPLAVNTGRLLLIVALQLLLGTHQALIPVLMFPVVLGVFLKFRSAKAMRYAAISDDAQNEMIHYVDQVVKVFRLIADYSKRPQTEDTYEKKIVGFNIKMILADAVTMNNKYFSLWLSTLMVGAWCFVGGLRVVKQTSSIGDFITTLDIFKEVGQAYTIMYLIIVKIHSAIPSLQRIIKYMNLPIDVEKRMRLNRQRRALGEEARQKARQAKNAGELSEVVHTAYAADLVPIEMRDVCYEYQSALTGHLIDNRKSIGGLQNLSFEFPQGKLIALIGAHADGKSTVLKLMGGVILPDKGLLLIPPHLRVLHISQEPLFFRDTLYNNLAYGTTPKDSDSSAERIVQICQKMCVPSNFCDFLMQEKPEKFNQVAEWGESLSLTQRVLLNLVRALVSNPEVLLIHKPTLAFDDAMTARVFDILKEFVDKKGIEQDPSGWAHRRPRTCVITTGRSKGVKAADLVFNVTKASIIQQDRGNISNSMLE